MVKPQIFLSYMPALSTANILLMSQRIQNAVKCRKFMTPWTVAVNTGRWKTTLPVKDPVLFPVQQCTLYTFGKPKGEKAVSPHLPVSHYQYQPTSLTKGNSAAIPTACFCWWVSPQAGHLHSFSYTSRGFLVTSVAFMKVLSRIPDYYVTEEMHCSHVPFCFIIQKY